MVRHGSITRVPAPYFRMKQQLQQRPKPPKKEEITVKAREVFRHIFPANKSGCKIISVGLDPGSGFEPIVTLSKLGNAGVRFDHQAFEELCNNADFLRGYFDADTPYGQMQISADITIGFTISYRRPVLVFKQGNQTNHETIVVVAKETWEYIYNLLPMLVHLHKKLSQQTPIINQYFCDLCKFVRQNIPQPSGPKDVEELLINLRPSDIVQDSLEETPADPDHLFYELVNFCLYDVCACVNKIK